MKSTGIVRRIDELGRIVVPIEMRRALDIGERETMEISVEGDGIVLLPRPCGLCVLRRQQGHIHVPR